MKEKAKLPDAYAHGVFFPSYEAVGLPFGGWQSWRRHTEKGKHRPGLSWVCSPTESQPALTQQFPVWLTNSPAVLVDQTNVNVLACNASNPPWQMAPRIGEVEHVTFEGGR